MKNKELVAKLKDRLAVRFGGNLVISDSSIVSTVQPVSGKNEVSIPILQRDTKEEHAGNILLDQSDAFFPYAITVVVHRSRATDLKCDALSFPQTHVSGVFATSATAQVNEDIKDSLHNLAYMGLYSVIKNSTVYMENDNQLESLYVDAGGELAEVEGVGGFKVSEFGKDLEVTTGLFGKEQITMKIVNTSTLSTYQDTNPSIADGKKNFVTVIFKGLLVKNGGNA